MLDWLPKNAKLLILATATRSFIFGYLSILFPIYLTTIGYSPVVVGSILTASTLSAAILMLSAPILADRYGRKAVLVFFGITLIFSNLAYYFTTNFYVLLLAAITGLLGGGGGHGGGVGPYSPIQQAILAEEVEANRRNSTFSVNAFLGAFSGSGGALVVGLPSILQDSIGLPQAEAQRTLFLLGAVLACVFTLLLTPLKIRSESKRQTRVLTKHGRKIVLRFAVARATDGLATGVTNPFLPYWFSVKFGAQLSSLGPLFSMAELSSAITFLLVARIARKLGTVKAIVATHSPSLVLLFALPFAPTFSSAATIWLMRSIFGSMDVPLKQSYLMGITSPEERTAAAGFSGISTFVPQAAGPSLTGYFFQFVSLSAPFFVSVFLKTTSYTYLYFAFRNIKPSEEKERIDRGGTAGNPTKPG